MVRGFTFTSHLILYSSVYIPAIGEKVTYRRLESASMGPVVTPVINQMFVLRL